MHLQTKHGYELFLAPKGAIISFHGETTFLPSKEAQELSVLLKERSPGESIEKLLEGFFLPEVLPSEETEELSFLSAFSSEKEDWS